MQKENAKTVVAHLENAIASLSSALHAAREGASTEEYEVIQRAVGLSIARLSHEALDPIYAKFPELAPPGVLDQNPPAP